MADPHGEPRDLLRHCYRSWMRVPDHLAPIRVRWYKVDDSLEITGDGTYSSAFMDDGDDFDPPLGEMASMLRPHRDWVNCSPPPWRDPFAWTLALAADGAAHPGVPVRAGVAAMALASDGTARGAARAAGYTLLALELDGVARAAARASGASVLALGTDATIATGAIASGASILAVKADGVRIMEAHGTGLSVLDVRNDAVLPAGKGSPGHSPGCAQATHTPDKVLLTIAGTVNGTCVDCSNINGTHTLSWAGSCAWQLPGITLCGGVVSMALANAGGNTWSVSIGPMSPAFTVTLGAKWDGVSPMTLNRVASTSCGLPATCLITPQ